MVYVALYAVRPLVLFPASALAVAAGFVFGPVSGIALTVIGANVSASVAYLVGRYFGRDVLEPASSERPSGAVHKYAERVRDNGFEAVLTVQFAYLPFDLMNYLAGFLRVGWKRFGLATFLGSLPGIVSFVLLGASVQMDLTTGAMAFDPRVLLASAAILGGSIILSRYLKRRGRRKRSEAQTENEEDT